jgi:hypothetical protein
MDYKRYYPALVIAAFIVIVLVLLGTMLSPHNDKIELASTLDLSPSPLVSVTPASEPVVLSWRDYSNDTYNFTFAVPEGWHEQKFISPDSKEGTLVAFSPDPLPCETCTYFYNGYFSIKIYNQKTDPERYAAFLQRMNAVGKSEEYVGIVLDGAKGVLFGSTLAAENHGWIYELSLDKDQGNGKIVDSQLFKKVLSSFKFTYLLFNN